MVNTPFDPALFVRAPLISVSSGAALADALVSACPKDADAKVKKAAKHLKAVADSARADLVERNKALGAFTEEDSRVVDNESDRAWGALRLRLQAAAMLREHAAKDAARAGEVDAILFHGSTEFLKGDYSVQSARTNAILQQIDDDGLQGDIDRLAGTGYLAACRAVQPRYDTMVKERLKRDKATGQNLSETVRALQSAIVNYATKVAGTVEHDDPASAEAARVALLPITNHRDEVAPRASAAAPTKVLPPVSL